jgi:hypothetical protein
MPWWRKEPVVDPAAAVDELKRLLGRKRRSQDDDERVLELYDGLSQWRARGGFWRPEFETVWSKAQAACQP